MKKIALFKHKITSIDIMEINYELIMKYLVTNKMQFSSKKHILVYSDLFPEKFKNILQNKFYRYGVYQNESFYSTILTLLNKNFITNSNDEEIIEINKFKKSIAELLNDYELPKYLCNIDKKTIFNNITEHTIQIISEILSINFIIFDFKNELINIIYTNEICNPYKPTLLIANYEEYYEPIIYETDNKKIFSYNDLIIKKIYNSEFNIYPSLNKEYKINCVLKEILSDFNIKKDDLPVFAKDNNISEYTQPKLNKMVKKDLENILNNKNILYSSKMLKKDLIELILK